MNQIKWTPQDQARLQELEQRRKLFNDLHMPLVAAVVKRALGDGYTDQSVAKISFQLVNHADDIRDALAPYDSSVRAAGQ
jgi:hypothetical protein